MPVKVATAPTSVRPAVSAKISAPMSKSSRCSRTVNLPSRHRREERDLARAGNRRIGLHVRFVDRGADDFRILERVGVFLAARGEPIHQIANGAYARREIDLFLGLADPFAHPGEV